MVDQDKIREKLANLETQLKSLREKQATQLQKYQKNSDLQAIVERRLQNAIQACIDISMHIVSEEGPRKPESYADVFLILEEMEILNSELSEKMKEKTGFRNILAHEYAKIIHEEVYKHLQELDTFQDFAKAIAEKYLE